MFKYMEVYTGCMYSGKSTMLMHKYEECQNSKIYMKVTTKPVHPSKLHDLSDIVSHGNKTISGYWVNSIEHIFMLSNSYDHLFIDEAQFLDGLTNANLYHIFPGKYLYFSCLDMDYKGKPFSNTGYLCCLATKIEKLHGFCSKGNLTEFSHRLVKVKGSIYETTGSGYVPVCRKCFEEGTHCRKDLK